MLFRCVAAIRNGGGGCIEHFYEGSPEGCASAEAFAREHDKPGMGVYDCVSALRDRRRRKTMWLKSTGCMSISTRTKERTKDEIVKSLRDRLTSFGILSGINSSGRGIHAHFLFREPIEAGTPARTATRQTVAPPKSLQLTQKAPRRSMRQKMTSPRRHSSYGHSKLLTQVGCRRENSSSVSTISAAP